MNLKTDSELKIMQEGGRISAMALARVLELVRAGVSTLELNKMAEDTILQNGGTPSFKIVDGYGFATCINVNAGLVHGLPGRYKLELGDVVSVDLGTYYKGFHTDLSYTVEVETDKQREFLETGKRALENGIAACVLGNRVGDISHSIQRGVEKAGFSVSRDLIGHGIGRNLHESPQVPGYGRKNRGVPLQVGMTLAVEVIYQKGSPEIDLLDDGWTIVTADGSLAALFESTVAITANEPLVLTSL